MNASWHRLPRRAASSPAPAALVVLLALAAAACGKKEAPAPAGQAPAAAPSASAAGQPSSAVEATLIVHPADEAGKRKAVVELRISAPVSTLNIAFEVPAECQVVAGARRRSLGAVTAGQTQQSFVQFECQEHASGEVTVAVSGQDAAGGAIEKKLAASL